MFVVEMSLNKLPVINFDKLCELGTYNPPVMDNFPSPIKVIVLDDFTAIPYMMISSKIYDGNENSKMIYMNCIKFLKK